MGLYRCQRGYRYQRYSASVGIWVCAGPTELSDSLTGGPGESDWWLPDFGPFAWTPQQRLSLIPDFETTSWFSSLSWGFLLFSLPPWVVVASAVLRLLTLPGEIPDTSMVITTTWHLPKIRLCFDLGLSSQLLIHGTICLWTRGISNRICPSPNVVASPSDLLLLLSLLLISGIIPKPSHCLGIILDSSPFPASFPFLSKSWFC